MKLRPYQHNAVDNAIEMISERGNSLIVAGTGAGKTIMMAAVIGKYFKGFRAIKKRSPHILVLVHRTEIHTQNHDKFALVCPDIPTSQITAERKSLHGYVHFGMVQTVANLLSEFEKGNCFFDLIVIDEAHHSAASTYENIINWNLKGKPDAALFGVTATPNRGDKLPLIHLFDNFYQITSKYLIDSHYLVRPKFIDLSPVFDTDNGAEKGHLSKNCNIKDIDGVALIQKLCNDFLKNKEPGKSIIFAPSHEFCEHIYNYLEFLGRKPAYLGLNLDDATRKAELEKFEKGESEELINVDICTEGYDFPPLRNLVDFDTNGTQGQWVQKVGRVLRITEGKTTCTVIDFGGNVDLYPEGVEIDVALEGAVKAKNGKNLTESDFFKNEERNSEKFTRDIVAQEEVKFTPYHLPQGFESVNDSDYGIIFVACGVNKDCIIVGKDDLFILFVGNKKTLSVKLKDSFENCINKAISDVGLLPSNDKPISSLQIKMLAPEYPTSTLDWNGANCTLCWKAWKDSIKGLIENA